MTRKIYLFDGETLEVSHPVSAYMAISSQLDITLGAAKRLWELYPDGDAVFGTLELPNHFINTVTILVNDDNSFQEREDVEWFSPDSRLFCKTDSANYLNDMVMRYEVAIASLETVEWMYRHNASSSDNSHPCISHFECLKKVKDSYYDQLDKEDFFYAG